jgi:hypothetical protein
MMSAAEEWPVITVRSLSTCGSTDWYHRPRGPEQRAREAHRAAGEPHEPDLYYVTCTRGPRLQVRIPFYAVCLSAFQAFSPISVVKQRVWPNLPSFSW